MDLDLPQEAEVHCTAEEEEAGEGWRRLEEEEDRAQQGWRKAQPAAPLGSQAAINVCRRIISVIGASW